MESNNTYRISATGLKSIELDELTTNKITIDETGLNYYHQYNILLPTMTEGFYNLQDELDNIMISNTTQDLELVQLQSGLTTAQGNITTLGVLASTANINALAAIDLANQKNWIIFWQKPLRTDISNNVYLDYDTNYFTIDSSNNLTLNNYWKKDVSNNLYFTSGKIGIGKTQPNYNLDVSGNINCFEIYRNGTPISSTLSLFLPLTGGILSGGLTATTISATSVSAATFSGSGASLTSLNASNISSGTLTVSRGGIGTTTLTANQILIGNGTSALLQSTNLTWNNTSNTLSATTIQEGGTNLSSKYLQLTGGTLSGAINVANNTNITGATNAPQSLSFRSTDYNLGVAGAAGNYSTSAVQNDMILRTLTGTNLILQSGNNTHALKIDTNNNVSITNTLTATNFIGSGDSLTSLNASNISSGTLTVSRGGIGTTTLTSGQILIGNGTNAILQSSNLTWDNTNGRLGIGKTNPSVSMDISGHINVVGTVYSQTLQPFNDGTSKAINIRSRLTGNVNLFSETGNIIMYTNNINRFSIGSNGNINAYGSIGIGTTTSTNITFDTSGNINTSGIITGNGSGLTSLNASNITSGTLLISQGGTSRTSFNSNQLLIGNGISAISQTPNLIWDSSNNELDVSGNINGNNLSLKNLTNVNNTLLSIISETTTYNSKLLLGSGFSNNPINSFIDISTCQVITKTNNLYIDAAFGKTININSEANGDINSYGPWKHNGDISCNNNIKAVAIIENNISLTNKYIKKYAFNFTTTTPITLNNTTYYKYDINLNSYSNVIYFGTTPNRKFKISTWLQSGYHELTYPLNLDYEVIMSSPVNNGTNGAHSGLNILAYGFPYENYYLNKVTDSQQFLLRNSFDYLSYFSNVNNTVICCMILDYF